MIGTRTDDGWALNVEGVGHTRAAELSDIENAVRALMTEYGIADAQTRDLQLLLPDFEVDLAQRGIPDHRTPRLAIWSGLIALIVVTGALGFLVSRLFA